MFDKKCSVQVHSCYYHVRKKSMWLLHWLLHFKLIFFTAKTLHEICKYQKLSNLLISKSVFSHVVQKIMIDFYSDFWIQVSAIKTLQKITEFMLVTEFEGKYLLYNDSAWLFSLITNMLINVVINLVVIHARWVTIQAKNMWIIRHMQEIMTDEC